MTTDRDNALCYVAMSGPDAAGAACVIDGTPKKELAQFLKDCAGYEIKTVNVVEARRLLGNHFSEKSKEKQKAVPSQQLDFEDAIAEAKVCP